jgi:hypothetical protein
LPRHPRVCSLSALSEHGLMLLVAWSELPLPSRKDASPLAVLEAQPLG